MKGEKFATAMIDIQNTQECFVQLWLRLERTRRLFKGQYRRFCIRRVLQSWFGSEADDDFIWEVCFQASNVLNEEDEVCGWDELPSPKLYPRKHRELLRAIVSVKLGIGMRKVNLNALDKAYSIAFPKSTPINVNKKCKYISHDGEMRTNLPSQMKKCGSDVGGSEIDV